MPVSESETAQSMLQRKQINDLREENEALKNSIQRLHVELSAYQAKYRPVNGGKEVRLIEFNLPEIMSDTRLRITTAIECCTLILYVRLSAFLPKDLGNAVLLQY